jgi:protein-histidine N-methyltransferase
LITTLENGDDLRSRVYEGGFKTWECGVDLAGYLALCLSRSEQTGVAICGDDGVGAGLSRDEGLTRWLGESGICRSGEHEGESANKREAEYEGFDIVELGAGSAIPSLVLLNHILCTRIKHWGRGGGEKDEEEEEGPDHTTQAQTQRNHPKRSHIRFILCDYNIEVLRLVTAANVLLQLALGGPQKPTRIRTEEEDAPHPRRNESDQGVGDETFDDSGANAGEGEGEGEGELELNTTLHAHILSTLHYAGISIDFISGGWGDGFVEQIFPSSSSSISGSNSRKRPLLLLSSETLYSPASLDAFVGTLLPLLRRSSSGDNHTNNEQNKDHKSLALVAAKRLYFGVGGGVDEFARQVERKGGQVREEWDIVDAGVGRVVLNVEAGSLDCASTSGDRW